MHARTESRVGPAYTNHASWRRKTRHLSAASRSPMNFLALALFFFLAQDTPPPASVEGIVVKLGSSELLAGATVELHAERTTERLVPDRRPESLLSRAV